MGSEKNTLLLAELLQTKFCHDLAGVLGAISNGIELMEEDDAEMRKQAQELLTFSAAEALARLQFFRLAYGITDKISTIDAEEFQTLVGGFYKNSKVKLEYKGLENIFRELGKLAANIVYAANTCLVRGGNIKIEFVDNNFTIIATGDHIKCEDIFKKALSGGEVNLEEKIIQPYYTGLLAEEMGYKIGVAQETGKIIFTVSKV